MRRVFLIAALAALLSTTATATAAARKLYLPVSLAVSNGYAQHPESIGLVADGTLDIQRIHWHRWGSSKTIGQGTFVVYHQTSYKVIGRYKTTITSSDPTRAHHRLLYSLINISVPEAVQRSRDLPHELHYWLLGGSYSSNW
jgi:hypothetical protein